MTKAHLLFALVVVLALAGGLWWSSSAAAPPSVVPAGAATDDAAAPAEGAGVVRPQSADADPAREAAAVPATAAAVGNRGPLRVVTGRVVDPAGRPVAGAEVRAWQLGGVFDSAAGPEAFAEFDPDTMRERFEQARRDAAVATTDADGAFRLETPVTARAVPLRVLARGFVRLDHTVPVASPASGQAAANQAGNTQAVNPPAGSESASALDAGTLTLRTGAIVRGRVVDGTGTPVAAALVAAEGQGFGGFAPGGGQAPADQAAGEPRRRDRPAAERAGAERAGAEAGRMGADFWRQLPGVERFAGMFGDEVATDAEGRFELAHLEPGPLSVRARHEDHPTTRRDGLDLVAGAELPDLTLVLGPGARIEGRVTGLPEDARGIRVMAAPRRDPAPAAAGAASAFPGFHPDDFGDLAQDFGLGAEREVALGADGSFVLRGLRPGTIYRVYGTHRQRGFAANALCTERREVTAPSSGVELVYDAGVRVVFQVVAADTGAPLERLDIDDRLRGGSGMDAMLAMAPRPQRARDYPEGRVVLASLRPRAGQKLTLAVEALGYRRLERRDLELPAAGTMDLGRIELKPGPVVRVTVQAAGRPVAGASVRLETKTEAGGSPLERLAQRAQRDLGGRGLRTDEQGLCATNAPPDGVPFTVVVQHREHAPFTSPELRADGDRAIDLPVELGAGGRIEATVVDPDGQPVANGRVERRGPDGGRDVRNADAQGRVLFERLEAGEHRLRLAARGGGGRGGPDLEALAAEFAGGAGLGGAEGAGWQTAVVVLGETVAVRLQQERTASLRGLVRSGGQPLAGARVTFAEGAEDEAGGDVARLMAEFGGRRGRSARSGEDGGFELRELPIGQHRLRLSADGRAMPTTVPVTIGYGVNVVEVTLDDTTLRGTVLAPDGTPVGGASIQVAVVRAAAPASDSLGAAVEQAVPGGLAQLAGGRDGRSVRSADDGTFELRGVQPGVPLRVRATARGFAAAVGEPVTLSAGEQRGGLELRLQASGKVKVTVADGGPFHAVTARLLDASGQPRDDLPPAMQMLRRGEATLDGLRPGSWQVQWIAGPEGVRETRVVEVVAGATAELVF
ncbi:MAG: carboxypeptidase regulatory-like domain-containing protein [Planctomycetota bacterium]